MESTWTLTLLTHITILTHNMVGIGVYRGLDEEQTDKQGTTPEYEGKQRVQVEYTTDQSTQVNLCCSGKDYNCQKGVELSLGLKNENFDLKILVKSLEQEIELYKGVYQECTEYSESEADYEGI